MKKNNYILAFDTANEQISIGLGRLEENRISIEYSFSCPAHRESNTKLLPEVQKIFNTKNITPQNLRAVACGRGPGSFTGVRIALATAKGIAAALSLPLIGFNTLDAVAWNCWLKGKQGYIYVVADAMRHEIYPALYKVDESGISRLTSNKVLKAEKCAEELFDIAGKLPDISITGDALFKYFEIFEGLDIFEQQLWNPSGESLLLTANQEIKNSDIATNAKFKPGAVLPVYTRLSDAEEGERQKLSQLEDKNLVTGVQDIKIDNEIEYKPFDNTAISQVAILEKELMPTEAWNSSKLSADYIQKNRSWWYAQLNGEIIAYAGAMQSDDKMELLKIAVAEDFQHQGIAKNLLSYVANDMRALGCQDCILEVKSSNEKAIAFYKSQAFKQISMRKNYYSDGKAAIIMQGPLPILSKDVAGMNLESKLNSSTQKLRHPIIFSVESSCDETACAITCDGKVISDVVASQVDFHKRFGGVVPEIASRKHIEAICGVADECLEKSNISWTNIDAIAVTYAPGLVGALVVGMAFAKGLAFALKLPFIGVNHLEGHLFANKLSGEKIELPAVASLLSGGNTILVHVKDWGSYKTLGETIDDAVGEAFDKVSKYLNLGYPGGPIISKLAKDGNPKAIDFPRAMLHSKDYQFSLSGLKTAVINYIDKNPDVNLHDLCASFEQAIIDVQAAKARTAIQETGSKSFLFGGGVAANPEIRSAYSKMCNEEGVKLIMAPLSACGDNAAMIGLVANERFKSSKFFDLSADVQARTSLDAKY